MLRWPTLVPIYSHRFMPAAPAPDRAPVLSVHGSDIIFYGSDLLDYLRNEFVRPPGMTASEPLPRASAPLPVHPWTDLDSTPSSSSTSSRRNRLSDKRTAGTVHPVEPLASRLR